MTSTGYNCGKCKKFLLTHLRVINCISCKQFYHVKCCGISHKAFYIIQETNDQWNCEKWQANVIQPSVSTLHQNSVNNTSSTKTRIKSNAKSKCGKCQKHMRGHLKIINCDTCGKYFHVNCSGTSKKVFLNLKALNESWLCLNCLSNELPFYDLDNNDLYSEIKNTSIQKSDSVNSMPSFTIQSLLDQMQRQNFEMDEFMSATITSKYFTPSEFIEPRLPSNKFSMLHINIASLGKYIDELRCLLDVLKNSFDIIGITETRYHDDNPLTNIDIDGYVFKHTHTKTGCGGAGMYIKSCYEFDIIYKLSQSNADISESLFIELKREGKTNVIIGCIYRHHSPIPTFLDTFFRDALNEVNSQPNKICALMGDFNIDLIKYASENYTG